MPGFLVGHATHPDWRAALALAGAQVDARRAAHEASTAGPLTLGFVYFTDHYAAHAQAIYTELRQRWPGLAWVGSVGVGVCAGAAEYIDEPALALTQLRRTPRNCWSSYTKKLYVLCESCDVKKNPRQRKPNFDLQRVEQQFIC